MSRSATGDDEEADRNRPRRRWALVIGGSRGLGAECAIDLASRGYSVALTYKSNRGAAEGVRDRTLSHGAPAARAVPLDLLDPHGCVDAVRTILDEFGTPPRCLVHSGAELMRASVADTDIDAFARLLTINCTSAYAIAREVGLSMRSEGIGTIVFLSSVIGQFGVNGRVAYATSKAGLTGMTKALAVEFAPAVRVNAVMLGTFATDMTDGLQSDPSELKALASRTPLGRLGEAYEVGRVVGCLVDDATFVTGAVWPIDGGVSARLATPTGDSNI